MSDIEKLKREPEYEVQKVLVLSTGHMPEPSPEPDFGALRSQAHEYGWIVFLPEPRRMGNTKKWLRPVVKLANKLGCRYINFDSDGWHVDDLPTYDW